MTKKDQAADRRLQKKYGIGLEDYNNMLKNGGGGCWICHKPPKPGRRLSVEHDHRFHKYKIQIWKDDTPLYKCRIYNLPCDDVFYVWSGTKKEVKEHGRKMVMSMSIRGLVDWQCNSALQKFRDNPERMESAAQYIRNFEEKLSGWKC